MLNCAARDESVLFHNAHTGDARGVDDSGLIKISPIRGHCCVQPTFPCQIIDGLPHDSGMTPYDSGWTCHLS
jgi:hypothetical protein